MTPSVTQSMFRLRNRHLLLFDLLLLSLTPAIALALRVEYPAAIQTYLPALFTYTVFALGIRLGIFWLAGFYCRFWRYAGYEDLLLLARGSLAAAVVILLTFLAAWQVDVPGLVPHDAALERLPRSLPLIDAVLAFGAITATRMAVRYSRRHGAAARARATRTHRRVLVVGAGDAGAMLVNDMQSTRQLQLQPVGFVDDDPEKSGMYIHGVPVLGDRHQLAQLVAETQANLVVIAMPSAPGKVVREVVAACDQVGVATRIVPSLHALLDGTVKVQHLREVQIEDLLRREPVQVDVAAVHALLRGKRVLVTGGGGSIGSELCRQVLQAEPATLVLVGHGENSIFETMAELRPLAVRHGTMLRAAIADVRFRPRVDEIFAAERPEVVFHAAAHKHVPLMEENPGEAITNNVQGTANVVHAAWRAGVGHFVLISTDKAVNPSSIMGATKRVAELLVRQVARESRLPYVAVRFGNVLGSRGSVVLTFRRQIAAGGPVTVTHPEMKRFFMTIPEAVQLVLQATTLGQGGEVFMLDMGEPVKIVDLARDLIELSGLRVGRDIDIAFNGMRPGEKLEEELFIPGEHYGATRHAKIFTAGNGHAAALCPVPLDLDEAVQALIAAAQQGDRSLMLHGLRRIVPEFGPPAEIPAAPPAPVAAVQPQFAQAPA